MAELQQKTAVQPPGADVDHEVGADRPDFLTRIKGAVWEREAVGAARAGAMRSAAAPTWRYATGGRYAEPALHEQKRCTFESLHAAPIALSDGEPKGIDRTHLKFSTRHDRGRGRRVATMLIVGDIGHGHALVGPEMAEFHRWLHLQLAAASAVRRIMPVVRTLRVNGVLDADHRIARREHVLALIEDIGRSGRVDAYAAADAEHAEDVLNKSREVDAANADLQLRSARLDQLGTRILSLQQRIHATRSAAAAFYSRRRLEAEEREVAGLLRERQRVMTWLDGLSGLVTGWCSIFASAGAVRAGTTRSGSPVSGSANFLSAVGKIVVREAYAGAIDEAYENIAILRNAANAHDGARLASEIRSLQTDLQGYAALARQVAGVVTDLRRARDKAYSGFGAAASRAMPHMTRGPSRSTRSGLSGSAVQSLFANVPLYEELDVARRAIEWPALEGEIPLSGYLFSSRPALLLQMAEEAAKLRWWQARLAGVSDLLERLHLAMNSMATQTRPMP